MTPVSSSEKSAKTPNKWQRSRQAVQVLALALFLYLLLGTQQGSTTILPHDLFFRLDPLAGITAMLAGRSWIPALALGGATLLLTLVAGRAWCSWLCPLGTIIDWIPSRKTRKYRPDIHPYWRQVKHFLLFAALIAAALGSLALLVFDPITILFRTLASVILPALNIAVTAAESWLYGFGPLQPAVEWFDGLVRGSLITEQPFFLPNLIIAGVFAGILVLETVRPRFWCRYLCPLGGLLGLCARVSHIRYKVDEEKCTSCQRCATICPTAAIDPEQKFAASAAECTTCLDCMEVCPTKAISFQGQWGSKIYPLYDPSRRQFLASLGAASIGAALLWFIPFITRKEPRYVRPPGTTEEQLLSKCIRCGECAKVCPTGVIQPGASAASWDELWTPTLVTRLGYCDYSCTSCGQVCPTGAITELPLKEKQRRVIGVAVIDRERCIPWADGIECNVCEEVCPLPEKAIRLDHQGRGRQRNRNTVQRPHMIPELCIGCGICEYLCPLNGESAIRVFPPGEDQHTV